MAETTQGANGSGSVFISYSRKDKAFVQKLNDALDAAGVQAWVDREGIELASDWMERITSSIQGTDAFLWDMATAQEMARIPHDNPVTSVSFSPDGAQLLTVSRKVARIWDISAIPLVPNDGLIQHACAHLVTNLGVEDWTNYFGDEPYRLICPDLKEEH